MSGYKVTFHSWFFPVARTLYQASLHMMMVVFSNAGMAEGVSSVPVVQLHPVVTKGAGVGDGEDYGWRC